MIHIIRSRATPEQMQQMLESLGIYIKLAVDVKRRILAGGGELHADCEQVLLRDSSDQANLWGLIGILSLKLSGMNQSLTSALRLIIAQQRFKILH